MYATDWGAVGRNRVDGFSHEFERRDALKWVWRVAPLARQGS
jgi:hypothetical protein